MNKQDTGSKKQKNVNNKPVENTTYAYEYGGWKYRQIDSPRMFEIIPDKKIPKPSTFFKYYCLNDYNVDALKNHYVYASHPNQLNDVYDASDFLVPIDNPYKARRVFRECYDDASMVCQGDERLFYRKATELFQMLAFKNTGIVSLTDSNANMVLWGSYTNHEGFCVEFDVSFIDGKSIDPFPMNYVKELEHIDWAPNMSNLLCTLVMSSVKQECWSHEHEWRLLLSYPNQREFMPLFDYSGDEDKSYEARRDRKFYYYPEAIKSITLGRKFFHKKEILKYKSETSIDLFIGDLNKKVLLDCIVQMQENDSQHVVPIYQFNPFSKPLPHSAVPMPIRINKMGPNRYNITELSQN